MTDVPDARLLEQFARNGSEEAFTALVQRHIALVHSVALRHTANAQHAQDITQAVFVILARKAGTLGRRIVLPGWLYHTARLTAANLQRAETSRVRREQEAFMQSQLEESVNDALWRELSPQLDEAMAGLCTSERDALVLRYFQNKSMAEVGKFLGLAENTAQKRVSRALEKLRKFFTKRGVSSTTAILAGAISTHSVQAVPATLAKSVTAVALAKGATASASTLTLIKGALKIMAWAKAKTAASGAGVLLVLGASTAFVIQLDIPHRLALAEGRRAIANHLAEPLDLTASYDTLVSRFGGEMTAVPHGFQTFAHVPLQIDGTKCLWGAGHPQYGGSVGDPQVLGIPVSRKFETLYVCHTAIFSSRNNTPVYELVFRYEDGDSVTNLIKYGADVLDWYANPGWKVIGPTGRDSQLAWHGDYVAKGKTVPLRFSLTALNNPRPSEQVASIDLYSSKNASCALILAMTAGRSGLMR
jgi:RNA polymerase sigma factor (sigma-70 family)